MTSSCREIKMNRKEYEKALRKKQKEHCPKCNPMYL